MTFIRYTPEQHDVLDHIVEHDGILLVSAGAGTGKSFLGRQVAEALQPRTALYTAFNKGIVTEGITRFQGLNVMCKTWHALAYSYVKPTQDIQDISYTCIKENISYRQKFLIIEAINNFFVSASTDMFEFMEEAFPEDSSGPGKFSSAELAIKYIEMMIAGELNPTFNFLLKYFHLMLVEGTVKCSYDLVILDEINDTTAVTLEIFKLIDAPKKLGLGEPHQAIYDFLKLANGFEVLSDAPVKRLTQSFRCSTQIAKRIEGFMKKEAEPDFDFKGTDEPVKNGKFLYCTLTNAEIIRAINDRLVARKGFNLLRKVSEIFAYPMAITTASQGKQVYQKVYKFLEDEYKEYVQDHPKGQSFMAYLLEHVDDQNTKSAVALLLSLKRQNINLFKLYADAKEAPVDLNYTIATVFTSKGLEYETVWIADDLNSRIKSIRDNGGVQTHDDLVAYRCYYVAASRCGKDLRNAGALSKY